MKKVLITVLALFCAVLFAAMPQESIIIEAESFSCTDNAWVKRPHYTGYYDSYPSGGAHLMGANGIPGIAVKKLNISRSGKYHLWVRYLDLSASRARAGFILTVKRNGQIVAAKEFDRNSLRSTPEGMKKWGRGYGLFVWDKIAFDAAQPGEYTIEISKLQKGAVTTAGGRHLDLFLLTADLAFEPRITDLYPVFVRFKILDEQKTPAAVHFFGLRSNGTFSWYTGHHNINKKGWFSGPDNGAGNMKHEHLKAGDVTPWFEVSKYLTFNGFDRLQFYLLSSYHAPRPATAAFEVQFSRTPSEEKLWKTFRRTGKGCGLQIAINLVTNEIVAETDASENSVKLAQSVGFVPGKRPEKFPVTTGLSLDPAYTPEQVMQNELKALEIIGINGTSHAYNKNIMPVFQATKYLFHLTKGGCLNCPDEARMDAVLKSYAAQVKAAGTPVPYVINVMDEPGMQTSHFKNCAYCKAHFAEYLESVGAALEPAEFTDNPADGIRYYWSMRYANTAITGIFKTISTVAARHFPGVPVTSNFATTLVYDGNMLTNHCDWFDILGSGALSFGWGEDWANHTRTYQSNGFYTDVLRAACKQKGVAFGIFNIAAGKNVFDIQAKGFMAIGRGASALGFHNYGPWYVMSSDASNREADIFIAIKKIAFPLGAVENELLSATAVKGDCAMLFSRTSDIWNLKKDNVFGKERVFFNLLMKHCGYSMDIIDEESLEKELKNYTLFIACDSHIRKEFVPVIVNWVKAGGTLYMSAGALQFDQSNSPLPLRKMLNVPDNDFKLSHNPGTAHHGMHRLPVLDTFMGMPLIAGVQQPRQVVIKAGKGQVIAAGFFPGISYISQARVIKDYSFLKYPAAHRKYIDSLPFPVKPLIKSSNFLIETSLLTGKNADVIVMANFAGSPAETVVTFPGDYRKFTAVNGVVTKVEKVDGKNHLSISISDGGCFIKAEK